MDYIVDSHYHLDFLETYQRQMNFVQNIRKNGILLIGQSIRPSDFQKNYKHLGSNINLSLGFHPWNLNDLDYERELEIFNKEVKKTKFIGEIGLDFSPGALERSAKEIQIYIFREILKILSKTTSKKLLSIHVVKSSTEALDLIEESKSDLLTPIFHGYHGTSQDLTRLIDLGGIVSVGPKMLEGKRGRAYIKQVPEDRIVLESDLPGSKDAKTPISSLEKDLIQSLNISLEGISRERNEDMTSVIIANQHRIFGSDLK